VNATESFEAIGTTAVVVVARPAALRPAAETLRVELDRLDRACSRFRVDSELSRANARNGRAGAVGTLLATAIRAAVSAAESTDGLVTPTLGRHLRAAGYDRTYRAVRDRGGWTFVPEAPHVDAWREIRLDESGLLTLPAAVELDLGATAKALAADRAARRIASEHDTGVLIALGGDVAVAGDPPPGGWAVRVADDHRGQLDGPGPVVAISSGGLATSSVAARRWPTSEGEQHHVFDPRTGRSAETCWRRVSVAARTCLRANAASTAAIVLGRKAPAWLEERGLPALLVGADDTCVHVCGWPAAEAR
jgi:FAD:protein FMN transferase